MRTLVRVSEARRGVAPSGCRGEGEMSSCHSLKRTVEFVAAIVGAEFLDHGVQPVEAALPEAAQGVDQRLIGTFVPGMVCQVVRGARVAESGEVPLHFGYLKSHASQVPAACDAETDRRQPS